LKKKLPSEPSSGSVRSFNQSPKRLQLVLGNENAGTGHLYMTVIQSKIPLHTELNLYLIAERFGLLFTGNNQFVLNMK